MTLIIHAVGDGDLGIDVFAEGHKDKKEVLRQREKRICHLWTLIDSDDCKNIDSDDCKKLASAIFDLDYSPSIDNITNRFPYASLRQVFSHIGGKIGRNNGYKTVFQKLLQDFLPTSKSIHSIL